MLAQRVGSQQWMLASQPSLWRGGTPLIYFALVPQRRCVLNGSIATAGKPRGPRVEETGTNPASNSTEKQGR